MPPSWAGNPDTADVVIVGAGVTGCSIASHLLRFDPSLNVILSDRFHVGAGSSSRSTAAFRHQWSLPAHVSFSRYASSEYDRLAEKGFPLQFRRNGYLFLFTHPEAMDKAARRVEDQRKLGVPDVEVLEPGQLAGRVPGGDLLAADSLVGATWGPRDGFLDPLAVAQAYLDEARGAGVSYRPDTPVVALDTEPRRAAVVGVRFESGNHVSTRHVVNCAGVWSDSVSRLAGLDVPVRAAKRYLYHSHPVRGLDVSKWPMLIGDRAAHLRPSEGNTIMMAWERRPDPLPYPANPDMLWDVQDEVEPGFGTGTEGYGVEILGELARHMPALAEHVGLAQVTCGWYAITPDHKAILGPDPRLPGLYHATGFSGHGVMHAAATGKTLAEVVLGRQPTLVTPTELEHHFGLATLLDGEIRRPVEDMIL